MGLNVEGIKISLHKYNGLYFAIGVSGYDGMLLRSSIPQPRKEDVIKEIVGSITSFEICEDHKNLAKNLCKAFYGEKISFNVDKQYLDFDHYNIIKTPFEKKVLHEVMKIPYGQVRTYKNIAESFKNNAYRAVGNSLAKNPLPIIIPCHRVVKSDMSLGGYKGGTKMKSKILQNEGLKIINDMIIPLK
jgi:methylated-DNA-[protein]-cysteine S-methyltransferase